MAFASKRKIMEIPIIIVITLLSTLAVSDFMAHGQSNPASGSPSIGLYWDAKCTNSTQRIDFGAISPGNSKTITIYILNEASFPVTLKLNANFHPATDTDYLKLTWNIDGEVLRPNNVVQAVLTLLAFENASQITYFSSNIVITTSAA